MRKRRALELESVRAHFDTSLPTVGERSARSLQGRRIRRSSHTLGTLRIARIILHRTRKHLMRIRKKVEVQAVVHVAMLLGSVALRARSAAVP